MRRPFSILWILVLMALSGAAGFVIAGKWKPGSPEESTGVPGQLWTCGMHPQVIRDKPGLCPICHMKLTPMQQAGSAASRGAGSGDDVTAGRAVTIDPVLVQNMGIRVAPVTEGPLETTIRSVGYLREAQPLQRDVSLKVGGWVEKLFAATEGMHVLEGDPLFEIYSPDLLAAQEELLAAARALESLPAGGDSSTRRDTEGIMATAREKLLLWNVAPGDLDAILSEGRARTRLTFRSPTRGHVVEKMVVEGSRIEPGMKLFRIVDHSVLWLDLQVYERQLPFLSLSQTASARVLALPDRTITGSIVFIHPHVDEMTRAATARIEIQNPDLALKPGMYATVEVTSRIGERATLAPREAVIDTGTRQLAFVAREGGRFDPRDVRLGAEANDGLVEILEGLAPGELVVTSGQFLLDVESRTNEAIQKLLGERLLSGSGKPAGAPEKAEKAALQVDPAVQAALRPVVDEMTLGYLEIARSLAADDLPEASSRLPALLEAAQTLASRAAGGPMEALARETLEAVKSLQGRSIEEMRKRFKTLSDAMISVVKAIPPTAVKDRKLQVVHCPMFPGSWLQTASAVANPFYGSAMLGCGEVVEAIRDDGEKREGEK
ncbi:MAG TPA: efflux RND transporter periplasmic adaptor subunit [Planctomycetota bacterium]|nr:efflux RND transporter periplasmic adaptor subunit [Planctomycetota bacterium]